VETFDELWKAALPDLTHRCRCLTRDAAEAEELLGQVALRVWRGFPSFRGESSFRTWALRITEREAIRFGLRTQARRAREIPLDPQLHDPPAPVPPSGEPRYPLDPSVLRCALSRGDLSVTEVDVVQARLRRPGVGWEQLAAELGMTANACAVAHCRAIPKIRVHALTHHLTELGEERVRAAFRAARPGPPPLTPAEAEAFAMVVLRGRADYRRRGWRGALRSAAAAVLARLDSEEIDDPPANR